MRILTVATLLLLSVATAYAQEGDHSWHLLTRAHGGTVSLIKGMTQHECEFARARALGLPATEKEKQAKDARDAEIARLSDVPCPTDISEAGWKLWHAQHPLAQGCRSSGNNYLGWTMTVSRSVDAGTIETAECFQ